MTLRRVLLAGGCATLLACQGDNPGARDTGPTDADAAVDAADVADALADGDVHSDGSDAPDTDAADAADVADVPDALVERGFTSTPVAWVEAGTTYAYAVTVWPDDLVVELLNGPDGATLEDGVLRWDAPAEGVEEVTMDLAAYDDELEVDAQTFDVKVDHAPVFLNLPPVVAYVDEPFAYAPNADDPDGDVVTLTLEAAPEWMAVDDETIFGTPTAAGAVTFSVRATAGPLSTTDTFAFEVVERLRDVHVTPPWIPSSGGSVTITGCCFDEGVRVFWGASEATEVVRANAARLDVTFGPLLPGVDRITLAAEDVTVAEAEPSVVVVPRVISRFGDLEYIGPVEEDAELVETLVFRDYGTARWEFTRTESGLRLPIITGGGIMLGVVINRTVSLPAPWGPIAEPTVLTVTPALHAPGTPVSVRFAADIEADVVLRWGETSAACVVGDDVLTCQANVPLTANGPLSVEVDGERAPRWVPAAAAGGATTPELTTASQVVPGDSPSMLYVTGVGFDDPAAELDVANGEATIVWAESTEAVISLRPSPEDDGYVAVRLRIGGQTSEWWPFWYEP